ncbi:MAG: hypothetical protein Q4P84_03730 [Elusimicrobiales bacterium]|nr:hypothetical protein [Elusimicrobiota bacterium]MDO5764798.1 hypothetical protein [Elusimicrobiales bacterium]
MNPGRIKEWLVLLGIVGGVIMWFATMYGLPPRVDKLETTVGTMQKQIDRNDVKTDIILDDVKEIKSFLLTRHGGGK